MVLRRTGQTRPGAPANRSARVRIQIKTCHGLLPGEESVGLVVPVASTPGSLADWRSRVRSADLHQSPRDDRAITVDFARTAGDYAAYRADFPDEFFSGLGAMNAGVEDQRIIDLGTVSACSLAVSPAAGLW